MEKGYYWVSFRAAVLDWKVALWDGFNFYLPTVTWPLSARDLYIDERRIVREKEELENDLLDDIARAKVIAEWSDKQECVIYGRASKMTRWIDILFICILVAIAVCTCNVFMAILY